MPAACEVPEGRPVWVLDLYARLPCVRDRVGSNRPAKLDIPKVTRDLPPQQTQESN